MIATPTITQKNETPCADPFGERQPLRVYSTKPSPQVGMEKGKAQYERDAVQAGEEAGDPNAKKARIPPSLLRYDRLMQGCLGPAHGMHTVMKPDLVGWRYSSDGGISFGQKKACLREEPGWFRHPQNICAPYGHEFWQVQ